MTPEKLLNAIQNLRKDELIQLSEEDRVYLKLKYDIDTSVLKRKYLFNTIRLVELLVRLLDIRYKDDERAKIEIGFYLLVESTNREYVVKTFMDFMYTYRIYDDIDYINSGSNAWSDYGNTLEPELFSNSFYYEERLTNCVAYVADRVERGIK